MEIARAQVFESGSGQRYALVTLESSDQVIVFVWREPYWRGHVEFNHIESMGVWPGEATPEVDAAIRAAEIKAASIA